MIRYALAVTLVSGSGGAAFAAEVETPEEAVRAFLDASDPRQAGKRIERVLRTGAGTETLEDLLRRGRDYSGDVETGRLDRSRRGRDGREYPYAVLVPENYDPTWRYPVHVYMHGGIARPEWKKGGGWWRDYDAMISSDRISVFPAAWVDAPWWRASQVDNVEAILDQLRRTYNIDENRVHLFGISDGATGAYYFALRSTTTWASYLPFIGHAGVLANLSESVDGQLHAANLAYRPFFVVNGGNDPLYPAGSVVPYLRLFERAGADVTFRFKRSAGHDVRWWPSESAAIDAFVRDHPRDPLPSRVIWESEAPPGFGRAFWVVIEKLGKVDGESELPPFDHVEQQQTPALGIALRRRDARQEGLWIKSVEDGSLAKAAGVRGGDRIVAAGGHEVETVEELYAAVPEIKWGVTIALTLDREGQRRDATLHVPAEAPTRPPRLAFPHEQRSGRIAVEQNRNAVTVLTRGVRRYRLLLSSERFELDEPVTVSTNGTVSFEGRVSPDPKTMLEWAAADNDRTMLFSATLEIEVEARASTK